MKLMRRQFLFKPILFGGALALLQATPAVADMENAVTDLKACINKNLSAEKLKDKPRIDGLLKSCNAEYQALQRELDDGVREQVDQHLRSDLQHLLRGS